MRNAVWIHYVMRNYTTVTYIIHERSILIECSPKTYCEKLRYENPTCVAKPAYNF